MNTLAAVLRQAFDSMLNELHVCLPGRIVEYDHTQQRAKVKPLLKHRLSNGELITLPVIPAVPVVWPRGGGSSLVFPLEAGDGVLLVFTERALESWLKLGGDADPVDPRQFDLTDAVAIPGLNPFTVSSQAENATDTYLITGEGRLQIGPEHGTTVEHGTGKLKIGTDNKVALGNDAQELLDLLDQLLTAINTSTVPTSIGPQFLSKVTDGTVSQIIMDLDEIKGTL